MIFSVHSLYDLFQLFLLYLFCFRKHYSFSFFFALIVVLLLCASQLVFSIHWNSISQNSFFFLCFSFNFLFHVEGFFSQISWRPFGLLNLFGQIFFFLYFLLAFVWFFDYFAFFVLFDNDWFFLYFFCSLRCIWCQFSIFRRKTKFDVLRKYVWAESLGIDAHRRKVRHLRLLLISPEE